MRSKLAIWSDEGILSKPRATGFGRVRLIVVVCSVCGIAAASVYSQIGPDRGTPATDRAAGYGTEGRPAQEQRAQSPEPPSMIDAYVRSGATTGVAGSAAAAPKSNAKVAPPPAEPTSIAATPEPAAQPPRPTASSELTRTSPDSVARSARRSDDQGHATTSSSSAPDNSLSPERAQPRHRTSSAVDPASRSNSREDNSGRDYASRNNLGTAPRNTAGNAPRDAEQIKSEQGDAATTTAGVDPENNTARAPGNLDEKRRNTSRLRGGYGTTTMPGSNRQTGGREADLWSSGRHRTGDGTAMPNSNRGTGGAEMTIGEQAADIRHSRLSIGSACHSNDGARRRTMRITKVAAPCSAATCN